MKTSESIKQIAGALCKVQAELKDPARDTKGGFGKYVPLDGLLKEVRPLLTKHGLSVMQIPTSPDGTTISMITVLMHTSSEYIEFDALTLRLGRGTPQDAGSAITYARRYALSAILGVAWDNDDDGAKASEVAPPAPAIAPKTDEKAALIQSIAATAKTREMSRENITALIKKRYGKNSSRELTMGEARDLRDYLDVDEDKNA